MRRARSGDRLAQLVDECVGFGLGVAALHGFQLVVGDVLERDVEVFAYLGLAGHHFDHLVGKGRRVGVVEADPADAVDPAQGLEQLGQSSASVEVESVVGGILRNDDQFADAPICQFAGLLQQRLHRNRDVRPPDQRDCAVAAPPVAPFGDLQIGIVFRRRELALRSQGRVGGSLQGADNVVPVVHTEEFVHFGQLRSQLLGIALAQTAHYEETLDLARLLGRCRPQDHVDRLLLGVADESTGVDHHNLASVRSLSCVSV